MMKKQFHQDLLKEILKQVSENQEQKFRATMKHVADCEVCFPRYKELMEVFANHMMFRDK